MIETAGRALHDAAPLLLRLFVASAVLLAIAAAAARLMRGASAAVRYLVWAAAMYALLVLPLASLVLPGVPLRILRPDSSGAEIGEVLPVAPAVVGDVTPERIRESRSAVGNTNVEWRASVPIGSASPREAIITPAEPVWSWRARAVALWGTISVLLLASATWSRIRLGRLSAEARPVSDPSLRRSMRHLGVALGVRRQVRLLASSAAHVPLTWGTREPVVLLPADALRWPADRRDAVLAHELAHVARGDAIGHEMARTAAALFWINPLVWIALRAIRAERERACDDLVLATGARASSYAGDLLDIARAAFERRPVAAAALAMARPSELEGRLLAILDPRTSRRPATRRTRIAAAAITFSFVLPLAALRPAERALAASGAPHVTSETESRQTTARDVRQARNADESGAGAAMGDADEPVRSPVSVDAERRGGDPAPASARAFGFSMPAAAEITSPMPIETPLALQSPDTVAVSPLQGTDDLETLIAVARAAGGLSSDHEKAELLLAVIASGVRDDRLQRMLLASATTIQSGHHRHRVLLGILDVGLAPNIAEPFLDAAGGIAGTHQRAVVLAAFARGYALRDPGVREAFLNAAAGLSASERRRVLEAAGVNPGNQ